jgi:LPXTG-site transpeptidase (sortase) family protein
MAAGLGMLAGWACSLTLAESRQWDARSRWAQVAGNVERSALGAPPPALARPVDGVDFDLRVPSLGYRAIVREGVTGDVLFGGPGHYPATAWPGQSGTVGVAAHNVYWLRFDRLRPGDELILDTRYGTFHYRVTGMRVVGADDHSVLETAPGRRLALTTCWPLWAGQLATQRLAVFAS